MRVLGALRGQGQVANGISKIKSLRIFWLAFKPRHCGEEKALESQLVAVSGRAAVAYCSEVGSKRVGGAFGTAF